MYIFLSWHVAGGGNQEQPGAEQQDGEHVLENMASCSKEEAGAHGVIWHLPLYLLRTRMHICLIWMFSD